MFQINEALPFVTNLLQTKHALSEIARNRIDLGRIQGKMLISYHSLFVEKGHEKYRSKRASLVGFFVTLS